MANSEQIASILRIAKEAKANIVTQDFIVGERRNSYLGASQDMYDDMMNNLDDITFLGDSVDIIRNEYEYNLQSTIGDIINALNCESDIDKKLRDSFVDVDLRLFLKDDEPDEKDVDGDSLRLSVIEEKAPNLFAHIKEILDQIDDGDIDVWSEGAYLFDCDYDYISETISSATIWALGYCTVYWNPNYEDAEIARMVGLVPFEYKDTFYLALGGCGMDLSPKLDAYIALTCGDIPSDSDFFRQREYFEHVVGKEVYQQVLGKCTRKYKRYVITFEEE